MTKNEIDMIWATIQHREEEKTEAKQSLLYNIDKVIKFAEEAKKYPDSAYNISMILYYAQEALTARQKMEGYDHVINTLKAIEISKTEE